MAQAGPKNESRHKIVAEASYFGEGGGGQHRKLMRENAHNSLRDISLRMLEENMSQRAQLQKQIKFDDPKPFKATPQDQVNTSVHICIITQGGGCQTHEFHENFLRIMFWYYFLKNKNKKQKNLGIDLVLN